MSKYTPGPWALSTRTGKPSNEICGSDAICIVKSDGPMTGYIAHMVASGHYSKKLANARLIAAAPELLEACTQAHDALLALHVCDQDRPFADKTRTLLKAAIAKATG